MIFNVSSDYVTAMMYGKKSSMINGAYLLLLNATMYVNFEKRSVIVAP